MDPQITPASPETPQEPIILSQLKNTKIFSVIIGTLIVAAFIGVVIYAVMSQEKKTPAIAQPPIEENKQETALSPLPSPTPSSSAIVWKKFSDENFGIDFIYPSDWIHDYSKRFIANFIIIGETQSEGTEFHDGASFRVSIPIKTRLSLNEYIEKYYKENVNGEPYEITDRVINNVAYKKIYGCGLGCFTTYLTTKDGLRYEILTTSQGPNEELHTQNIEKMLSSFTIRKPSKKPNLDGIVFDPMRIKIGDQIGSMRVYDIYSLQNEHSPAGRSSYSKDDVIVKFEGEMIVEGSVKGSNYAPCIDIDDKFNKDFPRINEDQNEIFFCLEDSALTRSEFKDKETKIAKIIINNFKVGINGEYIYSSAELVKILSTY